MFYTWESPLAVNFTGIGPTHTWLCLTWALISNIAYGPKLYPTLKDICDSRHKIHPTLQRVCVISPLTIYPYT